MNGLLIAALVVVAVVAVALLVTAPMMKKHEVAAVARAEELAAAGGAVTRVEPRTIGFGTEPEEAGGLRGMGALAASPGRLAFVTWRPLREFVIERSAVTGVDSATGDPAMASKAMIEIRYAADGGEVVASFRTPDPIAWLDELGYDWGEDGRPEIDDG